MVSCTQLIGNVELAHVEFLNIEVVPPFYSVIPWRIICTVLKVQFLYGTGDLISLVYIHQPGYMHLGYTIT